MDRPSSMTALSQSLDLQEPDSLSRRDQALHDDVEFTALVTRQSRFIFRVAYSVLRDVEDSEDVVQETFLRVYQSRAWHRWNDERAFLARTAWRLAVGKRPRNRRRSPFDEPSDSVPDPEQSFSIRNQDTLIHQLIEALPEKLKQPLVLSALQELTSREIAAILSVSEGTIRTRIMRARQVLKEKLEAMSSARRQP